MTELDEHRLPIDERRSNPSTTRQYWIKKYGITEEQYWVMWDKQGGRCAICQRPDESGRLMPVDHDHATGKVRKLLCGNCNIGLGMFQDSIRLLSAAIVYLQDHDTEDQITSRGRERFF